MDVADLTEQHVIRYELDKDLLPLILSNCQYSLERGQQTVTEYNLPKIQQQILSRFLQGKPLITRTVSHTDSYLLEHYCPYSGHVTPIAVIGEHFVKIYDQQQVLSGNLC